MLPSIGLRINVYQPGCFTASGCLYAYFEKENALFPG